jgi:uncharacterized protein (TIGR00251 family)
VSDWPVWLRLRETGVELELRLVPGASRTRVAGLYGNRLKVQLAAPPVDGEANAALQRFLGKQLRVPPSTVRIVRGPRDRSKTVLIETAEPSELAARAASSLDPSR